MNNELFKLVTRRYLAWGVGGLAVLVIGFIAVWGAVQGVTELVTLAGGILGTTLGAVTGYYFSKKLTLPSTKVQGFSGYALGNPIR